MTPAQTALSRCKALALAAMIDAGGKPCWVASHAPTGSPAARPIPSPQAATMHLAPQYRPRRSPPAATPSAAAAANDSPGLTPEELRALAFANSTLLAALTRVVNRLGTTPPPSPRRACSSGAHSCITGDRPSYNFSSNL